VAVGLAWLDQDRPVRASGREAVKPTVTMDDVRTWLVQQNKNALVDMIVDQAMGDDRLRRRLFLTAAKGSSTGIDLESYRQLIDEAIDVDSLVDYHGVYEYASGIEEAVDSIEELLTEGHAAEAIDLVEHCIEAVEKAMGSVDDSDGHMSSILERLQGIHREACEKARPNPGELARRLFAWELRTDWDTFYGAAESYAGVLGKKGLDVYRKLAEAEWANVPPLGPGDDDKERYGKRFRITHIMETLAGQTGDVEAVAEVKKRDLSSAYAYLQIAETYKAARKYDLGLEWAERGIKTFPERTDSRLRTFLVDEYHRRGRHDDAMVIVWAEFADSPSLENYKDLKSHAERNGQWKEWRAKALDLLGKKKCETRGNRWSWPSQTELVRVLLWEKDVDAAWREACDGGCSDDLWMELAAKREGDHPEDALSVYQRKIEPTIERKNNEAYRDAVRLLMKTRALMARLGRREEFARYLASIRTMHKPKRNFMKLLDRGKWL
jgi:tetratricopeptide (TPR) repeat protein